MPQTADLVYRMKRHLVELKEDDFCSISRMIAYPRTLDYETADMALLPEADTRILEHSAFCLDIYTYTLGDRFGIAGFEADGGNQIPGCSNADGGFLDLLRLVMEVYELSLEHARGLRVFGIQKPNSRMQQHRWRMSWVFVLLNRKVCESTPEHARGLRDMVIQTTNPEPCGIDEVAGVQRDYGRCPQFVYDIITRIWQHPPRASGPFQPRNKPT